MLDILVAHLILQERKIAYVVTNEQLCIHQVGGKHDLLEVGSLCVSRICQRQGNVVDAGRSKRCKSEGKSALPRLRTL